MLLSLSKQPRTFHGIFSRVDFITLGLERLKTQGVMLQLINHHTHYNAGLYSDKVGAQNQLTCVIKRAWQFSTQGDLQTIIPAPAIIETDQFRGEINRSSLIAAREIMPYKEKSEIILYGSAQPPLDNHAITQVALSIEWENQTEFQLYKQFTNDINKDDSKTLQHPFGLMKLRPNKWSKSLFIIGERKWRTTFFGGLISRPKSIQAAIPLIYEFAYGGSDPKQPEHFYAKNPAGLGFTIQRRINHLLAPQIEISPLINQLTDQPIPAGFGPLPIAWQIADLKQTHVPIEINQVAPLDQRFNTYFFGNEVIKLKGLIAGIATTEEIILKLSHHRPRLSLHLDKPAQMIEPLCDTVVIDTDAMTLHQIWRAGIPWEINDQRHGVVMLQG